uniref:MYB-CC type transcription factor LHEQLE-containing domain-containing protein n=1 Tax=Oryza glumipatula TaxID=40148 RepID=A0A0E0AUD3_9ORYZ
MFPGLIHHHRLLDADVGGGGGGSSAGLVLTADPKPRLRWTADLHDRFVDAVAQLGGPDTARGRSMSDKLLRSSAEEVCAPAEMAEQGSSSAWGGSHSKQVVFAAESAAEQALAAPRALDAFTRPFRRAAVSAGWRFTIVGTRKYAFPRDLTRTSSLVMMCVILVAGRNRATCSSCSFGTVRMTSSPRFTSDRSSRCRSRPPPEPAVRTPAAAAAPRLLRCFKDARRACFLAVSKKNEQGERKNESTPKTIMRTMGVKGLTLFHLKSHLQKYRLGKQSGKEMAEQSKDASYILGAQSGTNLSPTVPTPDLKESQELKEALRAQMEVQRKLHEQVEVQRHVQIRMEAYQNYIDTLLEKACNIVSEQLNGFSISDHDLTSAGVMLSSSDTLSPSIFHQLSVSSISLHSPGGKSSPFAADADLFFQKAPEKRKSY